MVRLVVTSQARSYFAHHDKTETEFTTVEFVSAYVSPVTNLLQLCVHQCLSVANFVLLRASVSPW